MKEFTYEDFINNYKKDVEIFSEDIANKIYEEVYSSILQEDVEISDLIVEDIPRLSNINNFKKGLMDISNHNYGAANDTAATALGIKKPGFFSRIFGGVGSLFSKLNNTKMVGFLKHGFGWILSHPKTVLAVSGGAWLLRKLWKALSESGQSQNYPALRAVEQKQQQQMTEDFSGKNNGTAVLISIAKHDPYYRKLVKEAFDVNDEYINSNVLNDNCFDY